MIRRLWNWIVGEKLEPKPKPYAVFAIEQYGRVGRDGMKQYSGRWIKAVTSRRPDPDPRVPEPVLGPFRSEIDCEEYIQAANSR